MDCVFCDIVAGRSPAYRVFEDDRTLAFLDKYPLAEGHTLVIPKRHAQDIYDVEPEEAAAVLRTALKIASALKDALGCDGVNLFQSNGRAAGQSVFHFHFHVMPRWNGDHIITLHRSYEPSRADFERAAEKIQRALPDRD